MRSVFWKRVHRYPPILVRLLARHPHGPPLTAIEISERTGLPLLTIETISQSLDWKGIDIYMLNLFCCACGMDFFDRRSMKRVEQYLRAGPSRFSYLRRSEQWASYYAHLIMRWRHHNQRK